MNRRAEWSPQDRVVVIAAWTADVDRGVERP